MTKKRLDIENFTFSNIHYEQLIMSLCFVMGFNYIDKFGHQHTLALLPNKCVCIPLISKGLHSSEKGAAFVHYKNRYCTYLDLYLQ